MFIKGVAEHRLIAARALGRPLPKKAHVHHVDGDKANNRPGNLVICEDYYYHKLLHQRQKAFDGCGDPTKHKCGFCQQWDTPDRVPYSNKLHPQCATDKSRRYVARLREEGERSQWNYPPICL